MNYHGFLRNQSRFSLLEFLIVFIFCFVTYVLLFLFVYHAKFNDHVLQSEDILPTTVLPFSLIKEGNFDLNEYYGIMTRSYPQPDNKSYTPFYLKKVQNSYYSFFPQFTSIVAIPIYIIPALLDWDQSIDTIRIMSRLGGAFITSLSAGVFWLVLRTQSLSYKKMTLLLFIYAFCTNSLSISSQGLWQHGTSQLFLSLGLWALLLRKYPFVGLALGMAFISRPTNLLPFVVFPIFIYFTEGKFKYILSYILFGVIPIVFEILLEINIYGSALNSGYATHTRHFTYSMYEGFLGMWVSPSKGILVCSPILIFMFYGFWKAIKRHSFKDLYFYLTGIIIVHTLILGSWYNWFGGYSWGYRMASDIIPFMVFMLIPYIESKYFRKPVLFYVFLMLMVLSFFYHLSGLVFFDPVWHIIYDGKSRYWLWSIKDSQIIFSIKRLLFKFSLLENPIPLEYRLPV